MLENIFTNNRVVDAWNRLTNESIMAASVSRRIFKNDHISTLIWTVSYQYNSFFHVISIFVLMFSFSLYAYFRIIILSLMSVARWPFASFI